jgi:DNA topoisomerase I
MTKNLVVVESPAKARTIERYLGPGYRVLASYGHVRDLPKNPGKNKLGVDVDHDFAPEYVVVDDRRRQIGEITKAARAADHVYLATDLDREGEAIAWHVIEAANVPPEKARRVTFSEITEGAIREAFANPRELDTHLVDAQQARRVVDRLVGYTLSPLLWRKVRTGLSAGRVQSVAVRLVVEREREVLAFVAREYWTLAACVETADSSVDGGRARFRADVVKHGGKKLEIGDGETAARHVDALRDAAARVARVAVTTRRRNPAPPFTTSTLQQEASRKLGLSPRRTMSLAQELYEGVESAGQVGLITYMRTDSVAMAGVAQAEARRVIGETFGREYAMPHGRGFRTKTRGAQEAHEAIRPTSFERTPDSLAGRLSRDLLRLYRLIWQRAIASQMAPKEQETTTVELEAGEYSLRASATRTLFDGFARVYTEGRDDADEEVEGRLPPLRDGDEALILAVDPAQHFTEPPPRYTEAGLIRALEEHGIGRPSTYAATISTILDRGYVKVIERRLRPERIGEVVTDLLVAHFGEFVDPGFTARMEEGLDEVARGERDWVPLLREFYLPFRDLVDTKRQELRRADFTTEPSDEVCSQGHPMVIRLGRFGRFLACSTYPEHQETRPLPGEESGDGAGAAGGTSPKQLEGVGETCPACGTGTLQEKRGRFGVFVGCSRYPECRHVKKAAVEPPPPLAFEVRCPMCAEGTVIARRARVSGRLFWGCERYPKCVFTTSLEPIGLVHDADDGPVVRREDAGMCLRCGARVEASGPIEPGMRVPGGPPDPDALARQRSRRKAPARIGSGSRTAERGGRKGRAPARGTTAPPG